MYCTFAIVKHKRVGMLIGSVRLIVALHQMFTKSKQKKRDPSATKNTWQQSVVA